MPGNLSPQAVRQSLLAREEIALIDLREEAPFALSHPLFAAQLSAGRIETEILDRVPRKDTRIVLYDDGEGLTEGAAAKLEALGYGEINLLEGGLRGWEASGYELFQDVNSYSKAFGELVEHRRGTPSLPAQEVRRLIEENADIRILDARRFDEYETMSIPTGTSVPGAELVLRAPSAAPDEGTTIIVNCAGRTRSIIGTQSLINAGLPNRIFALRNGTIGWTLAGQSLDTAQTRSIPLPSIADIETARARAREVSYRAGVKHVDRAGLAALASVTTRTLYRFDVRDPAEFRAGHLPGFRSAPGGQLVQETDMFAPVRGARIVLADHLGPRADMTASWLAQMGWEVYVLDEDLSGALETGEGMFALPAIPNVVTIDAVSLSELIKDGPTELIDLATSKAHQACHIPGARFALRVELAQILARLPDEAIPVLTDERGQLSRFAAAEFGDREVLVLDGGTQAWIGAGLPTAKGMENALSEPRDRYKRPYEGTSNSEAAMQAYLDWEYGLVEQLRRDGTHGFYVI